MGKGTSLSFALRTKMTENESTADLLIRHRTNLVEELIVNVVPVHIHPTAVRVSAAEPFLRQLIISGIFFKACLTNRIRVTEWIRHGWLASIRRQIVDEKVIIGE